MNPSSANTPTYPSNRSVAYLKRHACRRDLFEAALRDPRVQGLTPNQLESLTLVLQDATDHLFESAF